MHTFAAKGKRQARLQSRPVDGAVSQPLPAAAYMPGWLAQREPALRLSGQPAAAPIQRQEVQHQRIALETIQQAALVGRQTPASALPHAQRIQQAFGRHEIGHIQAHLGPTATASARAMGAAAYATGDHVVFAGEPDLHTAAHEAAHVVQQRGGVHLAGGVGQAGDPYERHADAVADRVVAGQPADALLDAYAGGAGAAVATGPVQRALATYDDIPPPKTHDRWSAFYARPSKGATAIGTSTGFGTAVEGAGGNWSTRVTWGPVRADDGTSMEANPLGPDHRLGSSPAPDPKGSVHPWNKKRRAQEDRADGQQDYKAGHLLNETLGGPGDDARNLAAIPGVVNSNHATKVESKVKKIVNEEHGWVYYKVTTDQATDAGSTGNPKYTSALHCEWYQLDPATWTQANPSAGKVAGTEGKVDFAIPAPSTFAGSGAVVANPTESGLGVNLKSRAVGAAWSKVSRKSVVLVDTETVSAQALVMGPINALLDQMEISEHIQSVDPTQLTNHLSAIVKATALSAKETDAYKLIQGEKEKLEALAGVGKEQLATYDPPGKLRTALEEAPAERLLRYQKIDADVKALCQLLYELPHADELLKVAKEAWEIEDKPRRETEQLCVHLVDTAVELRRQYQEAVSVGLSHVAPVRTFYGLDAIDPSGSLSDQVKAIKETEVIDWETADSLDAEVGSLTPLRQTGYEDDLSGLYPHYVRHDRGSPYKATSSGYRKYAKERKGTEYLAKAKELKEKYRKLPTSNYDEQLLTWLDDQKGNEPAAKEIVRKFQLGYPDLVKAALDYLEAMETGQTKQTRQVARAIAKIYERNPRDVRDFYDLLKG